MATDKTNDSSKIYHTIHFDKNGNNSISSEDEIYLVINEKSSTLRRVNENERNFHGSLPNELIYAQNEIIQLRNKLTSIAQINMELAQKFQTVSLENESLKIKYIQLEHENKEIAFTLKTTQAELHVKNASISSLKEKIIEQNCNLQSFNFENLTNQCQLSIVKKDLELQKKINKWYIEQIESLQNINFNLERKLIECQTQNITKYDELRNKYFEIIHLKQKNIELEQNLQEICTMNTNKPTNISKHMFQINLIKKVKKKFARQKRYLTLSKNLLKKFKIKNRNLQKHISILEQLLINKNILASTINNSYQVLGIKYENICQKNIRMKNYISNLKNDLKIVQLKLTASRDEKEQMNRIIDNLKHDFNNLLLYQLLINEITNENFNNTINQLTTIKNLVFNDSVIENKKCIDVTNCTFENIKHKLSQLNDLKLKLHYNSESCITHADKTYEKYINLNYVIKELKLFFISLLYRNNLNPTNMALDIQQLTCEPDTSEHCLKRGLVLKKFKNYILKQKIYKQLIRDLTKINSRFKNRENELKLQVEYLNEIKCRYEERFIEISTFLSNLMHEKFQYSDEIRSVVSCDMSSEIEYLIFNNFENVMLNIFEAIYQKTVKLKNHIKILQIEVNSIGYVKKCHDEYISNLKKTLEGSLRINKILLKYLLLELQNRQNLFIHINNLFSTDDSSIKKFICSQNDILGDLKITFIQINDEIKQIQYKLRKNCC